MTESEPNNKFTILDWIGCVLAAMQTLVLLCFSPIAETFSEMLEDFGGELPTLTTIVLIPWFAPLLGAISVCIFALQWTKWAKPQLKRRRIIVVVSFAFSLLAGCICVYGLYLPIFKVAGALQ